MPLTRSTLTELCLKRIDAVEVPQAIIWLRMNGDPNARRVRLLGHHKGPYGKVIGWKGSDVIVEFDAHAVLDYLDSKTLDEISEDEDLLCEVEHRT